MQTPRCFYGWVRLLLACLCSVLLIEGSDIECPTRCLCFRSTVRCMFLQLDKVPAVPSETTVLDLRFNKIREIKSNAFKNLGQLNTLLLNNNHLNKIEDDAFAGLTELKYLYLYKNRIKTIGSTAFKGLQKLEQLYIHFNKIEKIESDTFADLPSLERLFLHQNKLSKIPYDAFKHLKSLRRLRLDSNALICDCEMMWLADMLKENEAATQSAATCEYPKILKGKPLTALNKEDFRCKRPKITEEPNDVDVTFGGTAYFSCKADGDPKPDIVWLHNSNEISPSEGERYSILTDGTLMITEAQDLDAGVYECMAKNPAGEIKSRAAKMHYLNDQANLIRSTLRFRDQPTDSKVPVGATIVLPCTAVGEPNPIINWVQNRISLPRVSRYHVSPSGSLTIKNVQKNDAGVYQCIATNNLSTIAVEANLIVEAPPVFLERPRDQEALEGQNVELFCIVDGSPRPVLWWIKDGIRLRNRGNIYLLKDSSILKIEDVTKSNEGIYTCYAENAGGQRNSSALLMIRQNVPPVFTRTPEDQRIHLGSSIELPCHAKGQPMPQIKWRKDGHVMSSYSDHHRINSQGDLYMFNVGKEDEGIYECIAENEVGSAFVSMHLTVSDEPFVGRPGDGLIFVAVDEARVEIDKALNHTLYELFGEPHRRQPGELLQAFRFPTNEAREAARSAEIYERALEIVWSHVRSGNQFNLSDFRYQDILSDDKLDLLANLSGCLIHKKEPSCSDMCFHQSYRTFDGLCNNFNHPRWGASLTPFTRLLPAEYENGFNTPIGWSRTKLYNGHPKPSARVVSTEIVSTHSVSQDSEYTHMLMQWGQFLDHDLDFSMPSISHASFIDSVDCATSCETVAPCFPIEVPPGDPRIRRHSCMEFIRSSSVCGSGITSVFFNRVEPREQVNQLTAFIDASNVYGNNERIAEHLREMSSNRGLMRTGILTASGKPLLPFNDGQPIDCKRDLAESTIDCFLGGDVRANEQLGLLSMHTLWVREHNRIAKELFRYNPHWDNEKLYHESRKIVGAIMQHVTYAHWLPKILGENGYAKLGPYKGYDPNVNPSIANVFATAALRFGHTLINPELMRLNETFQPIREGNLPLRKAFFAPFRLVEEGGMDPLFRGLVYAPAKLKRPDQLLNSDLTEHLFTPAHLVAQDLAALNVQRGRDHGLPSYNKWRKYCNLTVASTFDDLRNEITDISLLRKLQQLYGHPDNIDLWVGGISEDSIESAKIGPTFLCLLIDQFRRVRDGDRFWYENPGIFTTDQLTQIKQSSLARVICDNGDNITTLTKDVFTVPHLQSPKFTSCSSLPSIKLNVWTECCQECRASRNDELNDINLRPRRSFLVRSEEEFSLLNDQAIHHEPFNLTQQSKKEHDLDITEERIEGIEELVGKLEKTVHRLSRKVRKLEAEFKHQRKGECIDSDKQARTSGEKWKKDKCTSCQCENNQVTCWVETCQPSTCLHPRIIDEKCCPVC
ncbi:peroxidasin [Parasteatoda tepidariorum]|uniref:peroxidasin n=1 Tax=Parasteatoda tepidariorum TaxID=114398 RepID=UPI001C719B65|nr:peroxidasin [Parasteatoda tepidariorum]